MTDRSLAEPAVRRTGEVIAFTGTPRARVLLVDDDQAVLDGLRRQLRSSYDVSTATSAIGGLDVASRSEPFAVVVSDMRMPGLNGASFLRRMRELFPDTVRMLLTGYADADSAIAAVNEGSIFRFLCKPCALDTLHQALGAAVDQHRLLTGERELLEQTLTGSIHALLETLALSNPLAFARAIRLKGIVTDILDALDVDERWPIEAACMLSQLGAVTLPPHVAEKLHQGLPLDDDETAMAKRLPEVAERLLAEIPRLERVRAVIGAQDEPVAADPPLGSRILRIALDLDALEARGLDRRTALSALERRTKTHDAEILTAFTRAAAMESPRGALIEMKLDALKPGMVLATDIRLGDDTLLVARGQQVTPGLLERIRNFSARIPSGSSVAVIVPRR